MGNFTKELTKHYEFDGDSITVTMCLLKRKDALTIAPYVIEDDGVLKMSFKDQIELMGVAADILPDYIRSISGLTIEGAEVHKTSDDFKLLFEEMYFLPFLSLVMSDLMSCSFVSKEETDKVKKQQEDTSMDFPDTTDSILVE